MNVAGARSTLEGDTENPCAEFLPQLARVSAAAKAEAGATEEQFARIGGELFARLEELNRLVEVCGDLTAELDSLEVRASVRALEALPPQVEALGRGGGLRAETLRRLLELVDHVLFRVDAAQSALRPVSIIAISAKVEAARVGDESVQFTDFAEEIGEAFRLANASFAAVTEDMTGLKARLRVACVQEAELDARLAAAVSEAPTRILASLESLAARSAAAKIAAARVREETLAVASGVSDAVLSLQVGDCARQRLEHVSFALDLVAQVSALGALTPVGEEGVVPPAAAQGLARLCCAMQSAQVLDASQELVQDVESTVNSLRRLAASAQQISEIGAGLFAAGEGDTTFLAALERGIRQAQALFRHLEAAWGGADEVVASVLQTIGELEGRVASVAEAEREVRRIALNAMIKVARLGDRGRALGVIAQQLEACVELTTEQTSGVVARLGDLAKLTEQLQQVGGQDTRPNVGLAADSTEEALNRLSDMAARISNGLAQLRSESAAISRAVISTADRFDFHHRFSAVAEASARELTEIVQSLVLAAPAPESVEPVLACIARTYTMAREREVHAAVLSGAPGGAPAIERGTHHSLCSIQEVQY